MIEIYVDASYSYKSKVGSHAIVVVENNIVVDTKIGEITKNTTNNREEIKAVTLAIDYAKHNHCGKNVFIFSDSKYVVNNVCAQSRYGYNPFHANKDLLDNMYAKYKEHRDSKTTKKIKIRWVKGHANNKYNNLADELAVANRMGDLEKVTKLLQQHKGSMVKK